MPSVKGYQLFFIMVPALGMVSIDMKIVAILQQFLWHYNHYNVKGSYAIYLPYSFEQAPPALAQFL